MEIPFIKIDSAGNDYVYVNHKGLGKAGSKIGALARSISERHSGVGSDGLIVVDILDSGSAAMRIFNNDGSEAELCGNGLRGVALYARAAASMRKKRFRVLTPWNSYDLEILDSDSTGARVEARLGGPSFDPAAIGWLGDSRSCFGVEAAVCATARTLYCLAMPNPHAVIFVDNFDFDWQKEGREIENYRLFRNRTNVMFARVDSKKKVTVLPWERGSGPTRSCGSGAAAVTVASRMLGFTDPGIVVSMPGGKLKTRWNMGDDVIYQSGKSRIAFTGIFRI